MQSFASLSVLAMLIVTTVVGARLLRGAHQTRELPELLFGLGFIALALGLGGSELGTRFLWTEAGPLATAMEIALFGLVVAGIVAFHAATWRVFRPDQIGGHLSFALGSGLALIAYGMRIGAGDFALGATAGPGMQVLVFAAISGFTWSSMEAIYLYWRLRKQAKLGLASPVAASQIGLWGVATSLSAIATVDVAYNLLTAKRSPLDDPVSTALLLVTVSGASAAMWCAFFPPAALQSRLEAREPAPGI